MSQHAEGNYIVQADHGSTASLTVHVHNYPDGRPLPLHIPRPAEHFIGRAAELQQLLIDLQPGRTVTLCGPGGIGKTSLVAEAIKAILPDKGPPERFPDGIVFHSFYTQPSADLALEWIARSYGVEPEGRPEKAARHAVGGKQALVVLDGAEDADDLAKVLGVTGGCCVLITSRQTGDAPATPTDVPPLPDDAARQLLQRWTATHAVDDTTAASIVELLGFLPMAVRLAGRFLLQTKMDPAVYLAELDRSPLKVLDRGNRRMESVPVLMERSLAQVSAEARETAALVGALAMTSFSSRVVGVAFEIGAFDAEQRLGELVNFGLLQKADDRYEVTHALVHTYAREALVVDDAVFARLVAWYTEFTETESAKGLEGYQKLRPERAHLLYLLTECERRESWDAANTLSWTLTDENSFLRMQGYWTDLVAALEIGLRTARKRDHRRDEGSFLGHLAVAYSDLGDTHKAIKLHEQALVIKRQIGDRQGQGNSLGNLANAYSDLGDVGKAIKFQEQALEVARETGSRRSECNSLGNLGNAYISLGETHKAIEYYEQALVIATKIGNRKSKSNHLGNLGIAHWLLGNARMAIEFYEQALVIKREIGDKQGQGSSLGNIGNAYRALGDTQKAIEYYEQALVIAREIGSNEGEGVSLGNLGSACIDLGDARKAIAFFEQALVIARKIGSRHGEGAQLANLGIAYNTLGDAYKAIKYFEQALVIAREIGDRRNEGNGLGQLGIAYSLLGDASKAIECYGHALVIARETGDRRGGGHQHINLGMEYRDLGQFELAREHFALALLILEEIESPHANRTRQDIRAIDMILSSRILRWASQWIFRWKRWKRIIKPKKPANSDTNT